MIVHHRVRMRNNARSKLDRHTSGKAPGVCPEELRALVLLSCSTIRAKQNQPDSAEDTQAAGRQMLASLLQSPLYSMQPPLLPSIPPSFPAPSPSFFSVNVLLTPVYNYFVLQNNKAVPGHFLLKVFKGGWRLQLRGSSKPPARGS